LIGISSVKSFRTEKSETVGERTVSHIKEKTSPPSNPSKRIPSPLEGEGQGEG
jgi:hypothetical protein